MRIHHFTQKAKTKRINEGVTTFKHHTIIRTALLSTHTATNQAPIPLPDPPHLNQHSHPYRQVASGKTEGTEISLDTSKPATGAKNIINMCQQLVWAFSCGHTSAEFKKNWCPLAVQSGIACQPMAVVQRATDARCGSCQGKNGVRGTPFYGR